MIDGFEVEKISNSVFRIGEPGVPVFLINSELPIIIDTGYSFAAESFADSIKSILGKKEPSCCLITHSHFDHVGSAGYFKKVFPGMVIAASPLAAAIMSNQGAVRRIEKLNEYAYGLHAGKTCVSHHSSFIPFNVDIGLKDGDIIEAGDSLRLSVLETPGHTRDSLCFYLEPEGVLFTGDAAGIRHDLGYVFFDFLVDCDIYLESLRKISEKKVEIVCPGHYSPISGCNASDYLKGLSSGCHDCIRMFKSILNEYNGDIQRCMKSIKEWEYDVLCQPKQPEPAYLLNLEARIRSVARFV